LAIETILLCQVSKARHEAPYFVQDLISKTWVVHPIRIGKAHAAKAKPGYLQAGAAKIHILHAISLLLGSERHRFRFDQSQRFHHRCSRTLVFHEVL
jgi:hypothetical protein